MAAASRASHCSHYSTASARREIDDDPVPREKERKKEREREGERERERERECSAPGLNRDSGTRVLSQARRILDLHAEVVADRPTSTGRCFRHIVREPAVRTDSRLLRSRCAA